MSKQNSNKKRNGVAWAYSFLVFIIVAWLLNGYVAFKLGLGEFGDAFGVVNSLFSGLAFFGIILTIILQRKELELQREELKLTRGELAAQNETLIRRNFENTFFELLRNHNAIIASITIKISSTNTMGMGLADYGEHKGRVCFELFYRILKSVWNIKGNINDNYLSFYEYHQSQIGHYFRSLYSMVKFVDGSFVDEKESYINLICAQLSSFELTLLFYNSLSEMGDKEFNLLIEKYALFKYINKKELILENHLDLYEQSAYGRVDSNE